MQLTIAIFITNFFLFSNVKFENKYLLLVIYDLIEKINGICTLFMLLIFFYVMVKLLLIIVAFLIF
jgi:hypothetical protein